MLKDHKTEQNQKYIEQNITSIDQCKYEQLLIILTEKLKDYNNVIIKYGQQILNIRASEFMKNNGNQVADYKNYMEH